MKKTISLFGAVMALSVPIAVSAEEPPATKSCIEGELQADLVSAYVWRGQDNGGVSVQPSAAIAWKGLRLGVWGSYEIAGKKETGREMDITLDYTIKNFSIGITDYFIGDSSPFFKYKNSETNHTFEAHVGYDFGFVEVNWFTNVAGLDGRNQFTGKRAYSSYLELAAPFKLGPLNWNASVGMVPWSTDFYAADNSRHFHVNHVALQAGYDVKCGKKFTLPVFANLSANPSSNSMHFFIGCTLKAL